jgi:hypothetical protein
MIVRQLAGVAAVGIMLLPGATYYVLTSTNLALPPAAWMRVATNTFGSGGDFNFTNSLNPLVPQSFYSLQVP